MTIAEIPVMVTTVHRGVFFGYIPEGTDCNAKIVRLLNARMCVYWSADVRGVLGLAANGPNKGCRIGPRVPAITLHDVTAVIEVADDAKKLWEDAPWSR